MILQAVLETPAGLNVFEQDEETGAYLIGNDVFTQLALMEPQWPGHTFPNTREYNGRQLVHAQLTSDSEDPASLIDGLIAIYALDWTLHALASLHAEYQYDAQGDPILEDDGEGNTVHVREQVVYRAMPEAVMLDFMVDEYDDSEPPVASRPTVAEVPHGWSFGLGIPLG